MKHFLAMCLTVVFSATNATAFDFSSYSSDFNASDYREALNMGLKFYGGQRCGNTNNWMLINNPNVNRKYCHTKDGKGSVNNGGNGNYDLTGGWHDHGDHIKVATTMGYSALSLLIAYDLWPEAFQDNYDEAYGSGNDIPDVLDEVKIATDYFIKSFLDNGSFVYYVGFEGDHDVWVTSSKQSTLSVQKGGDPRPVWTTSEKGGPQAANYASALALMAMHYPDDTYSRLCTEYAKKAYEFAKMNKSAQASIPIFYSNPDPEWSDELSLAAILMYILTEDTSYKSEAFNYMAGKSASNNPLGWDNVADYAYYYLAKTDPAASNGLGETFADLLCKNVYSLHLNAGSLNPNGFPYYSNNWATNNLALGGAAAAALYSKLVEDGVITTSEDVSLADKFKQRIVDYILGNNEFNHTFLHGYKGDMTFRIRHRNAMGLNDNPSSDVKNTTDFMFASGAVIGGPSSTGVFNNIVEGGASYTETDCGCDYNAPFIVAIAGIVAKKDPVVSQITEPLRATEYEGAYWATYYNSRLGFVADDNTTVYVARLSSDKSVLQLTEVSDKTINAGEAVILKSTAENVLLTGTDKSGTCNFSGNSLSGMDSQSVVPTGQGTIYTLSIENGKMAFRRFVGNMLGARKAYLAINNSSDAPIRIVIDGEATGIDLIHNSIFINKNEGYYSIDGRYHGGTPTTRGIYIVNGKKVLY